MNDLRLDFLLELATSFIIVFSIGSLALGRGGLWVVGHASFLGAGGVYAWCAQEWGLIRGLLITAIICLFWISLVSLAAARLPGDRFVVVSLSSAYTVYTLFIGRFGEGVRNLPGASGSTARVLLLALIFLAALSLSLYSVGIRRSSLEAALLMARDQPWVLTASRYPVKSLVFLLHFLSAIPVCLAGVISALFYRSYSPNSHTISISLVFFAIGIPFGVSSLTGGVFAAVALVTLHRVLDLLFSSSTVDHLYNLLIPGAPISASSLSAPLTEALLAILTILFVRIRPQGIFGTQSRWLRR